MANECKVYEMQAPRSNVPIRPVPFLAKQTLSSTGVSAAFNLSTNMVTIISSLAGTVEFSTTAGVDPAGAGITFPINADTPYDFSVKAGAKVRFV